MKLPSRVPGAERVDGGPEPMTLQPVDLVLSAMYQPVEVEDAALLGAGPEGAAQ